ncbi:MAG: VWA domain-containing protein [Phycisphaerae bacterium]
MAVLSLVLMSVLLGFAALTVDVGVMYNAKADLQRTADAAALAGAARLAEFGDGNPMELAQQAAIDVAMRNPVFNSDVYLGGADVEFGRASMNAEGTGYDFEQTDVFPNAMRVTVKKTSGSSNGPIELMFAKIFGFHSADVQAQAIAALVPRDISVVADLSGSHTDDSELRNHNNTQINLLEVWENLPVERGVQGVGDGITPPPPGDPDNPGAAPADGPGQYAGNGGADPGTAPDGGQTGPTFGQMYYWGNTITQGAYEPEDDPSLMYLPRYQDWNDSDLVDMYERIGYSATEIDALMSDSYDNYSGSSAHWSNRVAVALGLARWDSGISGGLWQDVTGMGLDTNTGNGNGYVGSGELTWLVDYPWDDGSWGDYIYNYMRSSSTAMENSDSGFRYRFGLKTLTNYLLERQNSADETADLADVPTQPMQAVKDAVTHLTGVLDELDSGDQVSLEIYGTTGRHEVDLTHTFYEVSNRLSAMQAGHYDNNTNIGAGLLRAREELASQRHNPLAHKVIFLLTDGYANIGCDGCTQYDVNMGRAYALQEAQLAADEGIQIHCVSVGSNYDQALMDEIAEIGNGTHFHAEGTIDQYSEQLDTIFESLGGQRPVSLIQ